MPRNSPPQLTPFLAQKCRELVFATAERYGIPPVYITAHVRYRKADLARKEVMCTMITDFGFRRWQVAKIFRRDVRRLRKSVLGV